MDCEILMREKRNPVLLADNHVRHHEFNLHLAHTMGLMQGHEFLRISTSQLCADAAKCPSGVEPAGEGHASERRTYVRAICSKWQMSAVFKTDADRYNPALGDCLQLGTSCTLLSGFQLMCSLPASHKAMDTGLPHSFSGSQSVCKS